MGSAMDRWTIGNRNKSKADLYLDDATVSGIHAELIRIDDRRFRLHDCQSTNGTARLVNGRWVRITDASVSPDERLRFGRVETSVRDLLKDRSDNGPRGEKFGDHGSWPQELATAFSQIRDLGELKKSFYFFLDLLGAPAYRTIKCVEKGKPINPFCFMLFGAMIYTIIGLGKLTLPNLWSMGLANLPNMLWQELPNFLPEFILLITVVLVMNFVPYKVFRYISKKSRSFDDFMRMMAIVNGLNWILAGFLLLFINELNEIASGISRHKNSNEEMHINYIVNILLLYSIIVTFVFSYNIIVQKYFWRITYMETVLSFIVSYTILALLLIVTIAPIVIIVIGSQ
jgi:hypothetical protein